MSINPKKKGTHKSILVYITFKIHPLKTHFTTFRVVEFFRNLYLSRVSEGVLKRKQILDIAHTIHEKRVPPAYYINLYKAISMTV